MGGVGACGSYFRVTGGQAGGVEAVPTHALFAEDCGGWGVFSGVDPLDGWTGTVRFERFFPSFSVLSQVPLLFCLAGLKPTKPLGDGVTQTFEQNFGPGYQPLTTGLIH